MNDKALEILQQVRVDIAEIKKDVAHHIKRTDLAEENMSAIRADVAPIKKHVAMMEGALKLVGVVALLIGAAAALVKILE